MIRRIDRYVLRTFFSPLVWSALGLPGLLLVIDVFEKLDEFGGLCAREGTGGALSVIGAYYAGFLSVNAAAYASVIVLVAAVLCVATLARSNELVAMRSAGLSLRRALAPLLAAALVLAGLQALARETVVPALARRARLAHARIYGSSDPPEVSGRDRIRAVAPDGRDLWHGKGNAHLCAKGFRRTASGGEIEGLDLTLQGRQHTVSVRADRATWHRDHWQLEHGRIDRLKDADPVEPAAQLYTTLSPDALEAEQGPMELGLAALTAARLRRLRKRDACAVEFAKRFAMPLATVIALLMGLPIVLKRGAEGRARRVVSVAIALGLGLVYIAAAELAARAGIRGYLEPWLAVALPHAAFLALGSFLYARMDA